MVKNGSWQLPPNFFSLQRFEQFFKENPWTDFHSWPIFFCSIGNIFNFIFLKNRKKVKIAEISGVKVMITNGTIIFVARDIEHQILNNFPDSLSLT